MTDLRSECREVMGHPRETETVPVGVGLAAALYNSSQAQKGSFPDQGRITFTPVTGLQLFACQRSGQLQQDSQPCRSTHGPPQTFGCLQRHRLGTGSGFRGGHHQQLPAPRQYRSTGTPADAGLFRARKTEATCCCTSSDLSAHSASIPLKIEALIRKQSRELRTGLLPQLT